MINELYLAVYLFFFGHYHMMPWWHPDLVPWIPWIPGGLPYEIQRPAGLLYGVELDRSTFFIKNTMKKMVVMMISYQMLEKYQLLTELFHIFMYIYIYYIIYIYYVFTH